MSDVLIIDDDRPTRAAIRAALENAGFDVGEAENGRVALDALEAGASPDLLLLDLDMPVMDGYELLEHLRENPRLVGLPVVVVSAFEYDGRLLRSQGYVKKPLRADQVVAIARTWSRGRARA